MKQHLQSKQFMSFHVSFHVISPVFFQIFVYLTTPHDQPSFPTFFKKRPPTPLGSSGWFRGGQRPLRLGRTDAFKDHHFSLADDHWHLGGYDVIRVVDLEDGWSCTPHGKLRCLQKFPPKIFGWDFIRKKVEFAW